MKKSLLLTIGLAVPAMGTEMPPMIPDGPVTYDYVSYEDPLAGYEDPYAFSAPTTVAAPVTPAPVAGNNGYIKLGAYQSNYQVRGMGVTNPMSDDGYSYVAGHYILPSRNLFNCGVYQKVSGNLGIAWGASSSDLTDTPILKGGYALGKEIFPNLTLELGYGINHGGLEGFMARHANSCPHRLSQELTVTMAFNDYQRGFFGSAQCGMGFQGLTGYYFDVEAGYRFTDVVTANSWGIDLEVSAGWASSFSYWANDIKGTDAVRLRVAAPVFTHSGSVGRDGRAQITPWLQLSVAGDNSAEIDHAVGNGPIDHFQVTFGLDFGWKF